MRRSRTATRVAWSGGEAGVLLSRKSSKRYSACTSEFVIATLPMEATTWSTVSDALDVAAAGPGVKRAAKRRPVKNFVRCSGKTGIVIIVAPPRLAGLEP